MTLARVAAIIPDGNGTWAEARGLPRTMGHYFGLRTARVIIPEMFKEGITTGVYWAASRENFERPAQEVLNYLRLFKMQMRISHRTYTRDQIRLRVIGDWRNVIADPELEDMIERAEEVTKDYSNLLVVPFCYSGEQDFKHLIRTFQQSGEEPTEESIQKNLLTAEIPPLDMIIRTKCPGRHIHWSARFLPWQNKDTEFFPSPKCWPEYTVEDLKADFRDFDSRCRNHGGLP